MDKILQIFKTIIEGSFFTSKTFIKNIPFILFLAVLALFYITNRNQAEKRLNKINDTKELVRELRASSITIASELMILSMQTNVYDEVKKRNLKLIEPTEPPVQIIINQ